MPAESRGSRHSVQALLASFLLLLWHCTVVEVSGQVQGKGFFLEGVSYPNHGLVLLDEVGEGVAALNCVSDDPTCCSVELGFPGEYFFPNSSMVPSEISGSGYYRDRAADRVRLNRIDGATSGLFRCQIQTVANTMEDLYIGVYGIDNGSPVVSNVVNNGGTSRLTCTSSGGPATTVTWRRNCVALAASADYQQSQTVTNTMTATYSNTLTIGSGVTDRDGVYTCSVRNARGMDSGSEGLGVSYSPLPVTVAINERNTPVIGQLYTLMCVMQIANGVPTSPISHRWIGPDGTTVGTSSTLTISSFSESDVGEYGCQVTVGSGANERVGCAVTSVAPTIVVTVNGGTVMAGTQHTLTCSVTGAPSGSTKTYTWFKGGTVLPSCTSSQCIITSVQVSDAGTDYICRVSVSRSGMGIATAFGTGIIRVTLPNPMIRFRAGSFPPFFVGLDFTWRCNVENPGPALLGVTADIVWSQDGGEVTSDSRITVRDVVVDSPGVEWDREVMFSPLSSVDRGSYTCTATIRPTTANEYITNGVNTNTEELSVVTPTLTVSVSDPSTPRVLDVSPHNRFTLTCTASSLVSGVTRNLRKTVQWMRSIGSSSLVEITSATNGVTVTNSNLDQATGTSQITVTTTTAGQHSYMCRVSLDVSPATDDISGQDSSVVSVQGPVRPNAPTGLSSIVSSHDSATIQWTVTSISYDQETYRVEYGTESNRLTSTSSSVSSGSDITRTNFLLSVELSGLTRDTQYYYRVMASNTAGSITSAAPPMTFNTTDLAPEPPTSLQFSKLTSTSYSFSWVAPVVTNGVLVGHVITCDPQLDGLDDVTRSVGRDETSDVAVENFENGVTYDCSVQSQNNVGLSLPSSPVTVTTDEAAPTSSAVDFSLSRITVSDRSITVSWSPPNPTDRNGVIISYTVACSARVIGVTMVTMTYNQAGIHTLSGFRALTTYDCAIVARNNAGTGPPVATSITTPEYAPSAPENVMVDIIEGSPDMVDISWSPPSEPNGVINLYDTTCTIEGGQVDVVDETTIGNMDSVRLTGLRVASQYTCVVTASTSGGEGPPGMVQFLTLPAAPSDLMISGETNSRLTVSWRYDHPESGDNIFGYNIHVDDVIVGRTSGNDVLQYNITGLDPFTNYSIQVSAFNDNNGPRSGVVTAMTDEDIPGIVGCNSRWDVDDDTVTVNWDPPARPNGVILGYHIDLVSYTDGTPKTEVTVGGEERTYSFSIANFSLVPGVPYNVSIAANNSVGVGEECIVTDFARELRPPNNTLEGLMMKRSEDGTDIVITWNVLPLDKVMGFITLTITFLPSTSTGSRKRQTATTECTSSPCIVAYEARGVRITDLDASINYTIEIVAVNGNNEKGNIILTTIQGLVPPNGDLSTTTIVAIAVAITVAIALIVGVVVIILVIMYVKSRTEQKYNVISAVREFMRLHHTRTPELELDVNIGPEDPSKSPTLGLSYSLTCNISNGTTPQMYEDITYEWYKKGGEGSDDLLLDSREATHSFPTLKMTDKGGYFCRVSASGDIIRNTKVHKIKPIEPTLSIKQTPGGPKLKEKFYLKCIVKGADGHVKSYRWYKYDQPLPLEILPELNFIALRISDAGMYECRVTLGDISISARHMINLAIKAPRVYISPTSDDDEPFMTLTCGIELSSTVFSLPVTVITRWTGQDMQESETQATFSHSYRNRKTYISKAIVIKRHGARGKGPKYSCRIAVSACSEDQCSSAIKRAEAKASIVLKLRDTDTTSIAYDYYPSITIRPRVTSSIPVVGKEFTLSCYFSSEDDVSTTSQSLGRSFSIDTSYKWFKDGQILSREESVFLKFRILLSSDAGEYRCMVKNDSGTYTSTYVLEPLMQPMEESSAKTVGNISYFTSCPIARGTYSTVYKGYCQTKSGETINAAIRIIQHNRKATYSRELEALHMLNRQTSCSTRVVTMYANVLDDNKIAYIALEYCPMTLVKYVEKSGPIHCDDNFTKAVKLLHQLVEGVHYLHLNGHVHRDISPSNVLINDKGTPKLSGFGHSNAYEGFKFQGDRGGWDQNDVTPALDVFSLGCLIFYVLTDGIFLFGYDHKRVKDEDDIADYRARESKLQELKEKPIAHDLVEKMTKSGHEDRLTCEEVVRHCLFWNEVQLQSELQTAAGYEDLRYETYSWINSFPESVGTSLEAVEPNMQDLVVGLNIQMKKIVSDTQGTYIEKNYCMKDCGDFLEYVQAKFPTLLIRVFETRCRMESKARPRSLGIRSQFSIDSSLPTEESSYRPTSVAIKSQFSIDSPINEESSMF